MSVAKKARAKSSWDAWAGDRRRLLRIAKEVDDALELLKEKELARLDQRLGEGAASDAPEPGTLGALPSYQEGKRRNAEVRASKARAEIEALRTTMVTQEPVLDLRHEGPPADVLDAVDVDGLSQIVISTPTRWGGRLDGEVTVVFDHGGVDLTVQGTDPQWVRATHEALKTEIDRGVPRWAYFRGDGALGQYVAVVALVAFALAWQVLGDALTFLIGIPIFLLVVLPLGIAAHVAVRKLLPGFELTGEATIGRGSRGIRTVLVALATTALGILGTWVFFIR